MHAQYEAIAWCMQNSTDDAVQQPHAYEHLVTL